MLQLTAHRFKAHTDSTINWQIFNHCFVINAWYKQSHPSKSNINWERKLFHRTQAVEAEKLDSSQATSQSMNKTSESGLTDEVCICQISVHTKQSLNDNSYLTSTGMVVSAARSTPNCKWSVSTTPWDFYGKEFHLLQKSSNWLTLARCLSAQLSSVHSKLSKWCTVLNSFREACAFVVCE